MIQTLIVSFLLFGASCLHALDFEKVFTAHDTIMLLIDPQSGEIKRANDAAARFYGYPRGKLQSMRIQDINAFSQKQVKQEMEEAKAQDRNYFIFRHRTKENQLKTVEVFSRPYEFENNTTLLLSVINDISPQRMDRDDLWQYQQGLEEQVALQTQKLNEHYQKQKRVYFGFIMLFGTLSALLAYFVWRQRVLNKRYKDSSRQYQSLFDASARIAMIAVDTNGTITAFNTAASRLLGYSRQEVTGSQTPLLFHDLDELATAYRQTGCKGEFTLSSFLQCFSAKHRQNKTFTYIAKDGGKKSVSLEITPILDSSKNKTGYLGIARDITEKLQARKKLQESENFFKSMFELYPDPTILVDADTSRPVMFNSQALRHFGYTAKEFSSLKISDFDYNDDAHTVQKRIDATKEGETLHFESAHITKNGRVFDVSISLKRITINDKRYILSVFKDITDRKKLEQRLKQLNANLNREVEQKVAQITQKDKLLQEQAKLAAMGEMIGAIAHQWRQPLNALSINIQNLDDDYDEGLIDEAFLEDFIARQTKTIEFMSKTIEDFRNFFKTDKQKSDFSIHAVARSIRHLLGAQLASHNITLDISGEDFTLHSYQSEMQQVLLNIISNSKDAIVDNGYKNGTIQITTDADDKKITVCDSGGGVDEATLPRIFEPYFTTKDQGKGTGIGLHMTRVIVVEHMGGSIRAFNTHKGLCIVMDVKENRE